MTSEEGERVYNLKFLKQKIKRKILKKNDAKFACMSIDCQTHIYRPIYSYRVVYIGFVNVGFEIVWCEYLCVATFPCGGFGGPHPRKF